MGPPQAGTAVLFADIRDFTSYTASVGDEQAYAVAQEFARLTEQATAAYEGRVVKTYGDGVMAEFPCAPDAVQCAVRLHRGLGAYNERYPAASIAAGVGIAWGRPIQEGGDLFGHSVNLAKRLADHARGGQIVVCPRIQDRCSQQGVVRFLPLGELILKGLPPQPAFEAAWRDELARLAVRDEGLVLILTRDKLVVELSKDTQAKLQQAQARLQQRAGQPGLTGFFLRRIEKRLPQWIARALEQAGIGFEHELADVELFEHGGVLVLRPTGRRGLRLDRSSFHPQDMRVFLNRFQSLKSAPRS